MINHTWKIFIILCISSSLLIFNFSCNNEKKHKELNKPDKQLSNYDFNPKSKIIERIDTIPNMVLEPLKKLDKRDDYSPYLPNQAELKLIEIAFDDLPSYYKNVLQKRLVGIYFIDNFMGNGYTDWIFDDKNNIYLYFIFNRNALEGNISELLTSKENTCFLPDVHNMKVVIDCGTEYSGFFYILLHEATHVIDYVDRITPFVEEIIKEIQGEKKPTHPFVKNVWKSIETPIDKYDFSSRINISFYGLSGRPELKLSNSRTIYRQLAQTPFCSLYSSQSWAEDFAEYFTFYYLTQHLQQPYKIQIQQNNSIRYSYEPFSNSIVQNRKSIIDTVLGKDN